MGPRSRSIQCALFGLAIVQGGSARADDRSAVALDPDVLSDMSLTDLLNVDVSVASKVESSAADAPSSVTVFTQDEIQRMGVTTLQELLNYVPGFQSMRDVEQGVSDAIGARGRNTALSESVLILVDGQRLNDLYTGGASLLDRSIAVENIRQVEIIRGPGSALYGANAFVGVVEIKTLRGVNALWLAAGNIGARMAAASATHEVGGATFDTFVRIADQRGFDHEGVVDAIGQVGPQRDRGASLDANASVAYHGARLAMRHMTRELSGFLTFAALQDIEGNHESTRQSSVTGSYGYELGNLSLSAAAGYSEDQWRTLALFFPAGYEIAPGVVLEHEFRGGPVLSTRVYSASADAKYKILPELTVAAGVTFERSRFSDVGNLYNYNPITLEYLGKVELLRDPPFNKDIARNVFGAYAQGTYTLADRLTATVGLRADVYNDFGSSLNPRAALVYRTPIASRAKLMYGRAFRAPNFLELHDQYNPVDFGNEALDAETIDTLEAAYVQDIDKVFRGSATYFYSVIRDTIAFGTPGPDVEANPLGAPTFDNAGKSSVQGAELELRAQVVPGLDVYGTYTHLAGDDTPRFPRNFGALAVNYRVGPVQVNVSGLARGQVASLADQDPYVIANARVELALADHVGLFINARNLLDEAYRTPASLIPQGVPNDRRLVMVGLTARP